MTDGRCFTGCPAISGLGKQFALSRVRMRYLSPIMFAAFVAASVAACSSPTAPTDPTVVTMAPGQSTSVGALSVKFFGVTLDTRCPANALCIQAGDAYVALEASTLLGARDFELQLLNPTKKSTTHGSYSIELQEVSPYPFGTPINPADYRIKIRIANDIEPARQ